MTVLNQVAKLLQSVPGPSSPLHAGTVGKCRDKLDSEDTGVKSSTSVDHEDLIILEGTRICTVFMQVTALLDRLDPKLNICDGKILPRLNVIVLTSATIQMTWRSVSAKRLH
jgi:hypothetical protein